MHQLQCKQDSRGRRRILTHHHIIERECPLQEERRSKQRGQSGIEPECAQVPFDVAYRSSGATLSPKHINHLFSPCGPSKSHPQCSETRGDPIASLTTRSAHSKPKETQNKTANKIADTQALNPVARASSSRREDAGTFASILKTDLERGPWLSCVPVPQVNTYKIK